MSRDWNGRVCGRTCKDVVAEEQEFERQTREN